MINKEKDKEYRIKEHRMKKHQYSNNIINKNHNHHYFMIV